MSKKDQAIADKTKEGKKNAKLAEKKKEKNKIQKAADTKLAKMATALPGAGHAKEAVKIDERLQKLKAERKAINLAIRGERGRLREIKINLRAYDEMDRLRNMDPEDRLSHETTVALYKQEFGLELIPEQKEKIEEINRKRAEAREAMLAANGGDSGKEVGSGTATLPPKEPEEDETTDKKAELSPAVPAANDALNSGFRSRMPQALDQGKVAMAAAGSSVSH